MNTDRSTLENQKKLAIENNILHRNILNSWKCLDRTYIYVNGNCIQDVLRKSNINFCETRSDNIFYKMTDLKAFLKKNLLKNVFVKNKQKALNFLLSDFIYLGWKNPANTALQLCLDTKSNCEISLTDFHHKTSFELTQENTIDFITTDNGFSLQETILQYNFFYLVTSTARYGKIIYPDRGKKHVFRVQVTLDFDFNTNNAASTGWPIIKITDNSIVYGNNFVRSLIDNKFFYELFEYVKYFSHTA